MENDRSELRWGVEQRLEFIEFRLFWEGHVNRSDLMDQFGVSVNQASTDLNRYIGFAPENMVYDKSEPPRFSRRVLGSKVRRLRRRRSGLHRRYPLLRSVSCNQWRCATVRCCTRRAISGFAIRPERLISMGQGS